MTADLAMDWTSMDVADGEDVSWKSPYDWTFLQVQARERRRDRDRERRGGGGEMVKGVTQVGGISRPVVSGGVDKDSSGCVIDSSSTAIGGDGGPSAAAAKAVPTHVVGTRGKQTAGQKKKKARGREVSERAAEAVAVIAVAPAAEAEDGTEDAMADEAGAGNEGAPAPASAAQPGTVTPKATDEFGEGMSAMAPNVCSAVPREDIDAAQAKGGDGQAENDGSEATARLAAAAAPGAFVDVMKTGASPTKTQRPSLSSGDGETNGGGDGSCGNCTATSSDNRAAVGSGMADKSSSDNVAGGDEDKTGGEGKIKRSQTTSSPEGGRKDPSSLTRPDAAAAAHDGDDDDDGDDSPTSDCAMKAGVADVNATDASTDAERRKAEDGKKDEKVSTSKTSAFTTRDDAKRLSWSLLQASNVFPVERDGAATPPHAGPVGAGADLVGGIIKKGEKRCNGVATGQHDEERAVMMNPLRNEVDPAGTVVTSAAPEDIPSSDSTTFAAARTADTSAAALEETESAKSETTNSEGRRTADDGSVVGGKQPPGNMTPVAITESKRSSPDERSSESAHTSCPSSVNSASSPECNGNGGNDDGGGDVDGGRGVSNQKSQGKTKPKLKVRGGGVDDVPPASVTTAIPNTAWMEIDQKPDNNARSSPPSLPGEIPEQPVVTSATAREQPESHSAFSSETKSTKAEQPVGSNDGDSRKATTVVPSSFSSFSSPPSLSSSPTGDIELKGTWHEQRPADEKRPTDEHESAEVSPSPSGAEAGMATAGKLKPPDVAESLVARTPAGAASTTTSVLNTGSNKDTGGSGGGSSDSAESLVDAELETLVTAIGTMAVSGEREKREDKSDNGHRGNEKCSPAKAGTEKVSDVPLQLSLEATAAVEGGGTAPALSATATGVDATGGDATPAPIRTAPVTDEMMEIEDDAADGDAAAVAATAAAIAAATTAAAAAARLAAAPASPAEASAAVAFTSSKSEQAPETVAMKVETGSEEAKVGESGVGVPKTMIDEEREGEEKEGANQRYEKSFLVGAIASRKKVQKHEDDLAKQDGGKNVVDGGLIGRKRPGTAGGGGDIDVKGEKVTGGSGAGAVLAPPPQDGEQGSGSLIGVAEESVLDDFVHELEEEEDEEEVEPEKRWEMERESIAMANMSAMLQ
ncbi:unnamed protein product, partial [Sphacelaria rigidula]